MTDRPVTVREEPLVFACAGAALVGILHRSARPARRGVLIVVGGPQYRVGGHRQFIHLARDLAAAGIPTMRFDYRGMGDAEGDFPGFEATGPDIAAAIEAMVAHVPGLEEVVPWGLCDAASAILFHAATDRRLPAIVLLNPWVRTDDGIARAYIRHYYRDRLKDPAFWRKLARGGLNPLRALGSLLRLARTGYGGGAHDDHTTCDGDQGPLPDRMAEGLARFEGRVLLILSGRDLTAREFEDAVAASPRWRALLDAERVTLRRLADADHTFSNRAWRDRVALWTQDFVGGDGG